MILFILIFFVFILYKIFRSLIHSSQASDQKVVGKIMCKNDGLSYSGSFVNALPLCSNIEALPPFQLIIWIVVNTCSNLWGWSQKKSPEHLSLIMNIIISGFPILLAL